MRASLLHYRIILSKALWPPRSPDLTFPYFFLLGYLKKRLYRNKPLTVEALKDDIRLRTMFCGEQWTTFNVEFRCVQRSVAAIFTTSYNVIQFDMISSMCQLSFISSRAGVTKLQASTTRAFYINHPIESAEDFPVFIRHRHCHLTRIRYALKQARARTHTHTHTHTHTTHTHQHIDMARIQITNYDFRV